MWKITPGTEDPLAHMVVQRVVQDMLKLCCAWHKGIQNHPEYLKSHLVRGPFGFYNVSIPTGQCFANWLGLARMENPRYVAGVRHQKTSVLSSIAASYDFSSIRSFIFKFCSVLHVPSAMEHL